MARRRDTGTALVTGASAGLGAGFARALAADGHDLILTARRGDRLNALAAELRAAHGIRVEVIAADLARPGAAEALIAEIGKRGLAVNTLVNNAGFGALGPVAEADPAVLERMLDLNCRAVMTLSRLVLPGMIQMRRGAILNIASTAAFAPGPGMAVYYASKAFVLSFSQALHSEVRRHRVTVAALCPGPTITEFGDVAGNGASPLFKRVAGGADDVVRDGMRALRRNRAVLVSGLANKLMVAAVRITPRAVARMVSARFQHVPD